MCGCGQKTTIYRGKSRKYIAGHHLDVNNPMFNLQHRETHKKAINTSEYHKKLSDKLSGKNHPLYGVKFTEKRKIEMREAMLKSEKHKEAVHDEKYLENKSKKSKELWQTEEYKKHVSESLQGEKHWNWKGGISFEPYASGMGEIFTDKNDVMNFFTNMMKNKFNDENVGVKFFVVGEDSMPYSIIHY